MRTHTRFGPLCEDVVCKAFSFGFLCALVATLCGCGPTPTSNERGEDDDVLSLERSAFRLKAEIETLRAEIAIIGNAMNPSAKKIWRAKADAARESVYPTPQRLLALRNEVSALRRELEATKAELKVYERFLYREDIRDLTNTQGRISTNGEWEDPRYKLNDPNLHRLYP